MERRTPGSGALTSGCKHAGCVSIQDVDNGTLRDADMLAGRGQEHGTRASSVPTMDGRWVHGDVFSRTSTRILPDGRDMERGQGVSAHQVSPRQARSRLFYAKHMQTTPTPVHSRDAACPRPACRVCPVPSRPPRARPCPTRLPSAPGAISRPSSRPPLHTDHPL